MTSSTSAPGVRSTRHLGWPGALGLAISIFLIWWTLHDVQLSEVWVRIRGVRPLPFALAVGLATLMFPLRTIRWQYLLRLEGATLPFVPLWHATAIGFMATNLLPARAGEFARAYAARRLTGTRFTAAFASIAVERVFDGASLVALLVLAVWAGDFGRETTIGDIALGDVVRGTTILFLLALVVAGAVVWWPKPALAIVRRASALLLPARWAKRAVDVVQGLVSGLEALRSPSRLAAVTVWSFVIWGIGGASFWLALVAFGIDVPWSAALLLQSLLAFGIAVQFSPGFFGQWEVVARLTLVLYAVETGPAVSFAFGFHLGGFLPITLLGLWSLSRAHLHLTDLKKSTEPEHERNG